jgi:hypothetical protein
MKYVVCHPFSFRRFDPDYEETKEEAEDIDPD